MNPGTNPLRTATAMKTALRRLRLYMNSTIPLVHAVWLIALMVIWSLKPSAAKFGTL